MKIVNSDKWAPRDKLNLPMPIRVYWGLTMFYYILASVIYHLLNKDSYFNEDD